MLQSTSWALTVDSRQTNLEALRRQLTHRLTLLLVGASGLAMWLTLPQQPFSMILFTLFALLCGMGLGLWRLSNAKPILARHLLVWGVTVGLLVAMWYSPTPWLPFLGILLILGGAMLISGSELAITAIITLASIWLVNIGARDYPLYAVFLVMVLSVIMVWISLRALYTALQWTDTMRQRSDSLLEEVRSHRAELSRALKSSESANMLLRRTEQELITARRHAEQARRLKEQFAVNISHELRTPLNLILGFSEMMYLSPEVYGLTDWPPTLRRDVHQIYRSSRHLLEMIDDVLDLSRIEMASFTLNIETTDLQKLLQDTATIATDLFRGHPVQLQVDIAPNLPVMDLDRTRIRQVLLNLLNNAHRFTGEGVVTLSAKQKGNEVIISVSDTGPGIPEEKLAHIFDEFYQVDLSLRRSYQGAGLGLAISKRFVEAHRGYIWVESREGVGSTFSFALPVTGSHPATAASGPDEVPQPLHKTRPTLLVIDPDPAVATLVGRHLADYEIIQLRDVDDLEQAVVAHHPQVVVHNVAPGNRQPISIDIPAPYIECSLPSQTWLADELAVVACLAKPITASSLINEIETLGNVTNVLIVDDDRGFGQLVSRILETAKQPFSLRRAYDGRDALQAMRVQPPDLVLLDLLMPDVNGFEVLEEMRRDPLLEKIPVILITATSYAEDAMSQHSNQLVVRYAKKLTPVKVMGFLNATVDILKPHYDEMVVSLE